MWSGGEPSPVVAPGVCFAAATFDRMIRRIGNTAVRSPRQPNAPGRPAVRLTAAVTLAAGGLAGAAAQQPGPVSERLLYVCVQDDAAVAVVDMESLTTVSVIRLDALGFGPRAAPHDIAVAPDGRHWYVSLVGEHRVLRFDGENNLVGSTGMETPGMLRLAPGGDLLAVTRSMSAVDPPRWVGIAETSGMVLDEVDVLFPRPHGLAIHPDGRFAYAASLATNQVATIDLASGRVGVTDVPGPPHALVQMAVSGDGQTLVVTAELSGELLVFGLEDPSAPTAVASVPLGARPFDPVFSPDGASVWIPLKGADEVAVVERAAWSVSARITGEGIHEPHAVEFSPDGQRAFVTNSAPPGADARARLVIIDTRTREPEAALPLGSNLTGMGRRGAS